MKFLIMKQFKTLYFNGAGMIPTTVLQKMSPIKTLFPYHHIVSNERLPHITNLYPYKNVRDFTNDLDYLLKVCKPIEPDTLAECIRSNKALPNKTFLLTFDDGFKEIADIIAPILFQKGVPAIFFINPAFINNKRLFYRCMIALIIEAIRNNQKVQFEVAKIMGIQGNITMESLFSALKHMNQNDTELVGLISNFMEIDEYMFLKNERPYLTEEQIINLSNQGFFFGGHSWDHPYFKFLDEQSQIDQTIHSCNYIKSLINQNETFFSFPHDDISVKQSFFEKINTLTKIDVYFGTQNQKKEMQNRVLHRFNAERPWLNMRQFINGTLISSSGTMLLKRDKVIRN